MAETNETRKKHPFRNRLIIYSVLGLVVFAYLPHKVLYPGNEQALPPQGTPMAPGITSVDYTTKDGVALRGAWVRPPGHDPLTVVYFHGNAESAASGVPLGVSLAAKGAQVFLAEYRGYGGCSGRAGEEALLADGEAALEVVRATGVKNERLVLVGRSLGTGVAVELARRGHGSALLLVSPYTSITDVVRTKVGFLAAIVNLDSYDSLSRIGAVHVPIVVIHGTNDTLIPFSQGKRLVEAAPGARLVPIEGRGHNDLDESVLLARELAPWLGEVAPVSSRP